jgi:hypothetical protein
MKSIKYCLILGTFSLMLMVSGCNNNTKEAAAVAADFLNSYFSTDYQGAASCCTEEMSKTLMEAVEEYYNMEEDAKEEVKDISSNVKTHIKSVESVDKETIIVKYDMTLPEEEKPIESTLTLKKEEEGWRISQI